MILDAFLSAVSALIGLRLVLLVVLAGWDVLRRRRQPPHGAVSLPPLVVIVPAYNESAVIAGTVRSLLAADHPDLRVLVVDDGSTDETAAVVRSLQAGSRGRLALHVQPANGGKAAALNTGLALAGDAPLVATVDADTLVAPAALRRLCVALLAQDASAAASNVKVGNRINMLTRWQSIEYILGLNLSRRAQAALGCITTIPGAACVFRPEALAGVGGFSTDTVVEDTDLTISLLRSGASIVYVPEAVVFTEAPSDWAGLVRQRSRWMRGYLQCLHKHRAAFWRLDVLGLFGMPNLLFVHLLVYLLVPLSLPPLVRLLEWSGPGPLLWGLAGLFGAELLIAALALLADHEDLRALRHVPARRLVWPWFLLGVFGLVWWRMLRGQATGWGKPDRQGALASAGPGVIHTESGSTLRSDTIVAQEESPWAP